MHIDIFIKLYYSIEGGIVHRVVIIRRIIMVVKVVPGKVKDGGYEISEKRYIHKRELDILAMFANGINLERIGNRLKIA